MLRRARRLLQLGGGGGGNGTPESGFASSSNFPIVMMPSRNLWCTQQALRLDEIKATTFSRMADKLKSSRSHYQYPALTAPQIGWNVQAFTLYDGSVWCNPQIVREYRDTMCWTWEVCASQSFLVHYIERPYRIKASGYNEHGQFVEEEMSGMRSRLFQHCMDFMRGELFHRRIPDAAHVVPMDGFHDMSEWADDFPSVEARSTNLYTIYIPPTTFLPEYLPDADLLNRQYTDLIYPGHETMEAMIREEKQQQQDINNLLKQMKAKSSWEN